MSNNQIMQFKYTQSNTTITQDCERRSEAPNATTPPVNIQELYIHYVKHGHTEGHLQPSSKSLFVIIIVQGRKLLMDACMCISMIHI